MNSTLRPSVIQAVFNGKRLFLIGAVVYLLALAAMHGPTALLWQGEAVTIPVSEDRASPGTVWTLDVPKKGVVVLGHGVSSNQGVMALLAKSFAWNGYAAVSMDFRGHGLSRERFDWLSNPGQVRAWLHWARGQYPGLPAVYLGHSMGGFAGAAAFKDPPLPDAFVSLGALPEPVPPCPTLVAAGVYEELFTIEEAREKMGDRADVVSSPFSNHALETNDPALIQRIIAWVNRAAGVEEPASFPWLMWLLSQAAAALGCAGALLIAHGIAGRHSPVVVEARRRDAARRWSVNPYRIAGACLGCRGASVAPRAGSWLGACARGAAFGLVCAALLSLLLSRHMFTVDLAHPGRLLTWLILTPLLAAPMFLDMMVLERIPFHSSAARFATAALTRAVPLLATALLLRIVYFNLAFLAMMLVILAFILTMLALAHALATRATADCRAGAAASGVLFAWVIAFWFPLHWPWI